MDLLHQWILPPDASVGPVAYIAVAVVAMLFTSVSKGGFGGGAGVVSVPLLAQVMPLPFAVGMWLPILIMCDLATIRHYPKEWRFRAVSKVVPWTVAGILLAALLFALLKSPPSSPEGKQMGAWLNLGVACVSALFVALWLISLTRKNDRPAWTPTWAVSTPVGLTAGFSSTLAHAAGPIMTMYLLPQKLGQREFVGTTGRYFLLLNSLKVPFLLVAGVLTWQTLRYGAWLIVLAPLGVWLGAWLNGKVSQTWFLRVVYLFLALVAGKLASDAVHVLWPA